MARYVTAARYGNADISGGIDLFWLQGGLRISALEQIDFLARLNRRELPFSANTITTTLDVMELANFLYANVEALKAEPKGAKAVSSAVATMLTVLSPIAPHICEELWQATGHDSLLLKQPWPIHDPAALVTDEVEIVVQVNGKLRGKLCVARDASKDAVEKAALAEANVIKHLEGKTVRKVIVVPGKLVNVVVG